MKRFLIGIVCLLTVVLPSAASPVFQEDTGAIEGRVTRTDLMEGIPSVQIILQGPSPILTAGSLSALFTPNPALTAPMRDQIDALIASAPPEIPIETVANAANRMQAQLLGLPAPATSAFAAAAVQPPQVLAVTDANGHFNFTNLAPGRYQVRAQRDGYFGEIPAGSTVIRPPTTVNSIANVINGQVTPEVVVKMSRGGIISGRVRDPGGMPAINMQVTAYQIAYQDGRAVLQSLQSNSTDDRGSYRLFWLPPGDYIVAVMPQRPNQTPNPKDAFARTFFPGTVDGKSARAVTLAEASEAASVDINIRGEATTISGRVLNPFPGPNGQPSQISTLYVMPADSNQLNDAGTQTFQNVAAVRTEGRFEIRGVLPGVYDLMANVPDGAGRPVWARKRVQVGSGGLQDVELQIQAGTQVKIHMTVDGAAPAYTMAAPQPAARTLAEALAGISGLNVLTTSSTAQSTAPVPTPTIRLTLRNIEYSASLSDNTNTYDPSGLYLFPNVIEGKYYLQAAPLAPNAYIADVRIEDKSVYDSGFDVGNFTSPIEVTIKSNGARLQGSVVDSAKKPFASATVVLIPPQSRRQNPLLYKSTRSDAIGNFTFTGVAPGDYKLFAWEGVPSNAWTNAEFLAKFEDRGQPITVSANAAAIELKVIPK